MSISESHRVITVDAVKENRGYAFTTQDRSPAHFTVKQLKAAPSSPKRGEVPSLVQCIEIREGTYLTANDLRELADFMDAL